MAASKFIVPPPPNLDEKPFEIKDQITIFDGAMVYSGRHPCPRLLKGASVQEHLEFLRAGMESKKRIRARQSWNVLRELILRTERNQIRPVRRAFDERGQLDPIRTVILTWCLSDLARERGEYLNGPAPREPKSRPLTQKGAQEFTAKFIADEEAAGRQPTLACLEATAQKENRRGGREFLRAAFHLQLQRPVMRGRPSKAKIAKK